MHRIAGIVVAFLATWTSLVGCGAKAGGSTDGNTSWLKTCDITEDCGPGLVCACGRCEEPCQQSRDCRIAGSGSRCVPRSFGLNCADVDEETPSQVCIRDCTVDADCGGVDLACVNGTCTLSSLELPLGPTPGNGSGGSGPGEDQLSAVDCNAAFPTVVQQLQTPFDLENPESCGGITCHGSGTIGMTVDLESPGFENRLINFPGVGINCSEGLLIDPDDIDNSVFLSKLSTRPSCGSPMPLTRSAGEPFDRLPLFRSWVQCLVANQP